MDYQQFWLDLPKANLEGVATWEFEYSLRDYYGLEEPPNPHNIAELAESIRTNGETFKKYYSANTVR